MGKIRTEIKENLCEIEKIRLRNIAERKKIFEDLNLDSLKKQARAHLEYQKAQIAAKRRQCKECGEKFATESLKRQHIITDHIGPRSAYPRVKDNFLKKSSIPKKPAPIVFTYFTSQSLDGSQKTYCSICATYVARPCPGRH